MEKNIELVDSGLFCDNPECDWEDKKVTFEQIESWLNRPCPKCGENVLTVEDYTNQCHVMDMYNFLNSLSPQEFAALNKSVNIEAAMNSDVLKGAAGIELMDEEGPVMMEIDTHKGIKITRISRPDQNNLNDGIHND